MDEGPIPTEFRIEYDYQPSPEGSRRLSDALDLVIALLLDDLRRIPSPSSQASQPDGGE